MIVELYGPPASGKTTFAKRLRNEAGYERVRITSRWKLVWYNLIFLCTHPLRFFALLYYVVRYIGSWRLFYYKLMNLLDYHASWVYAHRASSNCVLDQGHHQNIISFFEHPVSSAVITRFVSWMPPVDILVVFDISRSQRATWLTERGFCSPREKLSESSQKRWQEAYEENHCTFVNLVAGKEGVRVIRNSQDLEVLFNFFV